MLRTARLVVRLIDASHGPALSAYHEQNLEHFAPYSPRRSPDQYSVAAWTERASAQREATLAGQAIHWLLFLNTDESRVIGSINFTAIQRGVLQSAYLGYQLDREVVGRGLMTEALTCTLEDAFVRANLHRVQANYMPTNARSARLLRRLGFTVEGYARDYLLIDGQWQDHVLTSLINPRWVP